MRAIPPHRALLWKTRIRCWVGAFALAALCCSLPAPLAAQQTAPSNLTSGYWYFGSNPIARVRIFKPDGTFVGGFIAADGGFRNVKDRDGMWTITNGALVLTYSVSGRKDTYPLPMASAGMTWVNKELAATTVSQAHPNQAPAGNTAPGTQAGQGGAAVLTTGYWEVHTGGKAYNLVFLPDGRVLAGKLGPDGSPPSGPSTIHYGGTWQVVDNAIVIHYTSSPAIVDTYPLPLDPAGARGTRGARQLTMVRYTAGGSSTPQTPQPETVQSGPFITPEVQQSASALIQTYHDSLVFVTGTGGSGSGFIATIGKASYLVTNVHVAAEIRDAAFKTLDGVAVQGGAPSMAIGEDIFCMALPSAAKPLEVMQGVDTNAAIGDDVVVLGNADGQGVVNTIIGKIVGIGPNLVEVDAPFVPGNSGSPIIHLKTGKVIGVATYTVTNPYDLTTGQALKQPVVRRFGYRLDSVKGWQAVTWPAFDVQAARMDAITGLTDDLYDFFRDLADHNGAVTPGRHTNPVIKNRIDDWITEKGSHPSPEDAAEADANFISFLKVASQADVAAAKRQIYYDYFVRQLSDQQQTRDQMTAAFQQIIQNLPR